jgi:hypothetical protein
MNAPDATPAGALKVAEVLSGGCLSVVFTHHTHLTIPPWIHPYCGSMDRVTPIEKLNADVIMRDALLQEYAECGYLLRCFAGGVTSVLDDFATKAINLSKKTDKFVLNKEVNKVYLFFYDLMWWNMSYDASRKGKGGLDTWNHVDECVVCDFLEVFSVDHGGVTHSLLSLLSRGPHEGWPGGGKDDIGHLCTTVDLTSTDIQLCLSVIKMGRDWLNKSEMLITQCNGYRAERRVEARRSVASLRKVLDRGTDLLGSFM